MTSRYKHTNCVHHIPCQRYFQAGVGMIIGKELMMGIAIYRVRPERYRYNHGLKIHILVGEIFSGCRFIFTDH